MPTGMPVSIRNAAELRSWLASAPPGTTVPAASLLPLLEAEPVELAPVPTSTEPAPSTWRERLWIVPAETRLGMREAMEALDRGRSWMHEHMSESRGVDRLPHSKLDGALVFKAGELRAWLRDHEEVVAAGPMLSTESERRLQVVGSPAIAKRAAR